MKAKLIKETLNEYFGDMDREESEYHQGEMDDRSAYDANLHKLELDYEVVKIETFEEAQQLGSHQWDLLQQEHYWDAYNDNGDIYFIFQENAFNSEGSQIVGSYFKKYDGSETFFVMADDHRVDTLEEFEEYVGRRNNNVNQHKRRAQKKMDYKARMQNQ